MKDYNNLFYKDSHTFFSRTFYQFSKISPFMSFDTSARVNLALFPDICNA